MPKPLLQTTPNPAVLLPPCCFSLKGQIQPFFHRQRMKGLKDVTFRKRHSSLSALTVSSLLQGPWSLSVDGESSSCKGSQIPWWRWSSIYALQKVTRLPCLGPSYSMFPLRDLEVRARGGRERHQGSTLTSKVHRDVESQQVSSVCSACHGSLGAKHCSLFL